MSKTIYKTRGVIAAGALAIACLLATTAPASATSDTVTVTSPIKTGSKGDTIGQATFTRTRASDGTTTVVVRGVTDDNISDSHLCYSTQPYSSRIPPGQCQLTGQPNGDTVEYTVTFPASEADSTLYFQFHVVTSGNTAYAGWQPTPEPFWGNVAVAAADPGTELPVGSLGGILAAAGAGIALWAATRRRRVAK